MPDAAATTVRSAWQRGSSRSSEATAASAASTVSAEVAAASASLSDALRRGRPVVVACEQSLESVLAGVGLTYLVHVRAGQARLARYEGLQSQLGEEVVRVPPASQEGTFAFAQRVLAGFEAHVTYPGTARRGRTGTSATVRHLAYAAASDDSAMPEVLHQYLRLGFAVGPRVHEMIADPRVVAFADLARFVLNECEHTRQFVRFSHMADDSYLATFSPKADTIPLEAPYFAARMRPERFCLVDPRHRIAAFHPAGERHCSLVRLDAELAAALVAQRDLADDEAYVRAMWQRFYRATGIPGRGRDARGYDLRQHWMPKRLWDGLSELDEPAATEYSSIPERYRSDKQLPNAR